MAVKDTSLLTRVKNGDRDAFNEMVVLYRDSLVSYASILVGRGAAQDVVQEVFVNVYVHRNRLRESGSLEKYLLKSVYNRSMNTIRGQAVKNRFKAESKYVLSDSFFNALSPDTNSTLYDIYFGETNKIMRRAIAELPPKCREVFLMSRDNGMSAKEIGDELGISPSTVNNHINKALSILKKVREEIGIL